ncbi:MAG: molybdopterin dehydrogenase [Betaproteobacteria bacterium RIFCSPLOWO2_12_FULL_65_14]|nr:MAG: molybdopterin dehydrogenase [Betaproteobacteria bacterium RIFCSPLOWO2_12_FULL_65_14]
MAVIRDVMPAFELFQPATVADTLSLLERYGADAWILAGGLDSFDWLKDRAKRTSVVVDLSQVAELRGIKDVAGGLEIGALTTLTEVVRHPLVRERFGLLMEAAELVASPQIRNQGTLGGNVSQDTRCWYYRSGWTCYRAGGNICYADTPTAINREHAILQADRCVAVSPSDTAPALIALDAQMVLRRAGGERVVAAEDYFVGPGINIMRMTVLQPGELLTAIRIPATWAGAQFYFEKVRDRQVWDFPLVNIASAMKVAGGTIQQLRLAVGAVAATPLRLTAVEAAVAGQPRTEATADLAGRLAVEGAVPLRYNGYKIPLMRNLVKRAIRGTGTAATT